MNVVHDLGAWWFFADTHISPAAIFGAVCLGAWLPSIRRWLWLHLTPAGRREAKAARRYWKAARP